MSLAREGGYEEEMNNLKERKGAGWHYLWDFTPLYVGPAHPGQQLKVKEMRRGLLLKIIHRENQKNVFLLLVSQEN